MRASQAIAFERMPPGDRGPAMRGLTARYCANRDAIRAEGPDIARGRRMALTRAERSLRKLCLLARRLNVRLDVEVIEFAPAELSDAQRHALAEALADPASCAWLADAALRQPQRPRAPPC